MSVNVYDHRLLRGSWAHLLREGYRSPEHIGYEFDVSAVTARRWLDEEVSPSSIHFRHALVDPDPTRRDLARRILLD